MSESTVVDDSDDNNVIPTPASTSIVHNLTDYADAIARTQFPTPIDGLKKVTLRLVWTATPKSESALSRGSTKSINAVGGVTNFHPFGDTSIYDVIVDASQPWTKNFPLLEFEGNNGSYWGNTPASPRYTKVGLSKFLKTVFLSPEIDIEALPMEIGQSGEQEPAYFIPSIPMALVEPNISIGYGPQSRTASLQLDNVCDLVSLYAEHIQKHPTLPFPAEKYAEKFLPDFPTDCLLINAPQLIEAYSQGQYNTPIVMEGRVKLSANLIIIQTLVHPKKILTVESHLKKLVMNNKSEEYLAEFDRRILGINIFQDEDNTAAKPHGIYIELKRDANVFEVWREIVSKTSTKGTYVPNPNYVIDGYVVPLNYVSVLAMWYRKRYLAILSTKSRALSKLTVDKWRIEAQLTIVDHTDRVIAIMRDRHYSVEQRISTLCQEFTLSRPQAEALMGLRISSLTPDAAEDLKTQLLNVKDKIEKINISIQHIGDEISATAQRIKREFGGKRHMHIPQYKGCVYLDGGFIQFESTAEVEALTEAFPKGKFDVQIYEGPHLIAFDDAGKQTKTQLLKHNSGRVISFRQDPLKSGYYTVYLSDGGGCYVDGVHPSPEPGFFYVKKTALGLTRNGKIERFTLPEKFTKRKTPSSGAATDIIYVYPDMTKPYYITVLSSEEKNILTIQKITPEDNRIVLPMLGEVMIKHHTTDRDWFIHFPETYTNRITQRGFWIRDAEALLNGAKLVRLDVGTPKVKKNPAIVYLA